MRNFLSMLLMFFDETSTGTADSCSSENNIYLFIIIGVFIVGMIFLQYLPNKRKQKVMMEMAAKIRVGDKIRTVGGIYGTVIAINDKENTYTVLSGKAEFIIDRGGVYTLDMLGISEPLFEKEGKQEETPAPAEEHVFQQQAEQPQTQEIIAQPNAIPPAVSQPVQQAIIPPPQTPSPQPVQFQQQPRPQYQRPQYQPLRPKAQPPQTPSQPPPQPAQNGGLDEDLFREIPLQYRNNNTEDKK